MFIANLMNTSIFASAHAPAIHEVGASRAVGPRAHLGESRKRRTMAPQKMCPGCHARKDVSEFWHNRSKRDRLSAHCKACVSVRNKKWHRAHVEEQREYKARYHKEHKAERSAYLKANLDHINARNSRYRRAHPQAYREYAARYNAAHKAQRRAYLDANRDHIKARSARYRREHIQRTYENRLRKVFGLTTERYNALLSDQGGVCAICRLCPAKMRLHVDHCHTTGHIRGLLCRKCNSVLGFMMDNTDLLKAAIEYLESARSRNASKKAA